MQRGTVFIALTNKDLMYSVYKLPRFIDYLYQHYYTLYQHYYGQLIELFPSTEKTEANLTIIPGEETSEKEDQQIYQLWVEFQ